MTDKKFTDEEIIRALECCISDEEKGDVCPMHENGTTNEIDCGKYLMTQSLSLINRQKAEIESLLNECGNQSTLWKQHFESIFETAKETAKAEAIKEFAERLKASCDAPHWCVWLSEIDQIAKELTEGQGDG